jgi:DNA-binding CsgD family transcriptional regulator
MRPVAADVTELVALAYEAGAEPQRWPLFLERIGNIIGDRTCTLQIQDLRRAQGSLAFSFRVDPAYIQAYESHFAAINPWTRHGADAMQTGRVIASEMALPRRELVRTEFYADFLRPQDVVRSLVGVIERTGDVAAFLSFQRSARGGDWTPDELSLLNRLMPHLQRALSVHRRLGAQRQTHEALVDTADRLPWGVLFLDERQRMVFANAAARRLESALLTRAVAVARAGGGAVKRSGHAPLSVTVAPLRADDPLTPFAAPRLAVFIVNPEQHAAPPETRLRQAFGLTPAEARLAMILASGASMQTIAAQARVTANTLKTHLKRIFAKTETRRQSELVRLLSLLGGPT